MIKPSLPRRWSIAPTISYYAIAVLSVAVAVGVAELITRSLHAEPIASVMLCAVILAAWFGGSKLVGISGDTATISVATSFKRSRITADFESYCVEAFRRSHAAVGRLVIVVEAR